MFVIYNVILFYMYFPARLTLLGKILLFSISILLSPIISIMLILTAFLMVFVGFITSSFKLLFFKKHDIKEYKEDLILLFSWKQAKEIARYNYFGEF